MKKARADAYRCAKSVMPPDWEAKSIRISVDWYQGALELVECYRPKDIPNAWGALKGTIDGLVDAGIVADDDHKHVTLGDVSLKRHLLYHHGRCDIVLIIEVLE